MHYYTFSALVFSNGQIRDAYNLLHKSEGYATIIEFKNQVKQWHAGPSETYGAIIIPTWQEIDQTTYDHIYAGFQAEG